MHRFSLNAITTWLIVVALSALAVAGMLSCKSGYKEAELIYSGDLALKADIVSRWAARNYNKPAEHEDTFFKFAYSLYKIAASKPNASPGALRRIGVLTESPEYFKKLTSREILQGRSEIERKELESEKAMWLAIYSGSVNREEIRIFDQKIRALGLGSAAYYALSDLYSSAGQVKKAAAIDEEAEKLAVATFWPIVLIVMLMIILVPLGLLLLIWSAVKWRRGQLYEKTEIPSDADSLYLGFNFYLITILATSALGLAVMQPKLSTMPSGQKTVWMAAYMLFETAAVGGLALLVLSSLLKGKNLSLKNIGLSAERFWENALWGIAGGCAMTPLVLAADQVWRHIQKLLPENIDTPVNPIASMIASPSRFAVGASLVSAVIFAPLFEEIFFRGAIYRALRTRRTVFISAAASAAVFAIMHPFPASFLPIFVMGIGLAIMTEARRSLVPAITAHAVHNGISFLVLFLISR